MSKDTIPPLLLVLYQQYLERQDATSTKEGVKKTVGKLLTKSIPPKKLVEFLVEFLVDLTQAFMQKWKRNRVHWQETLRNDS